MRWLHGSWRESPVPDPFASTKEGGKGALVKCVPVKEQNAQGGTLSGFYRSKNVKNGDKFHVQLSNVPKKC